MKLQILLKEFGQIKVFNMDQIKNFFPKNKFDKRYPTDYLKKWIYANDKYLKFLGLTYEWDSNGNNFIISPGNKVGMAPLVNPYGRKIYGNIIVKPKLDWANIYEILETIDWKYRPNFLENEEAICSSGILPRWFKALDTLESILQAINLFMKGMYNKQQILKSPYGNVNWNDYSIKSIPNCKHDQFFCKIIDYSIDLEIHRQFKGIVLMIKKDISNPKVPYKIENKAKQIIVTIEKRLKDVKYEEPNYEKLRKAVIPNFFKIKYDKAIQKCIEYIRESKLSNNAGNYYGLPWAIEMDRLFEYWIEYWAQIFARKIGARFFSDIKNNSRIKFYNISGWKSITQLKPDIIIEKDSKIFIIEVKYKRHLEYFQYGKITKEIMDEHRHDIHQILAYMSSSFNEKRIATIIYPEADENAHKQLATLVNFKNVKTNVDVILCATSFSSSSLLYLLDYIWNEKYSPQDLG